MTQTTRCYMCGKVATLTYRKKLGKEICAECTASIEKKERRDGNRA